MHPRLEGHCFSSAELPSSLHCLCSPRFLCPVIRYPCLSPSLSPAVTLTASMTPPLIRHYCSLGCPPLRQQLQSRSFRVHWPDPRFTSSSCSGSTRCFNPRRLRCIRSPQCQLLSTPPSHLLSIPGLAQNEGAAAQSCCFVCSQIQSPKSTRRHLYPKSFLHHPALRSLRFYWTLRPSQHCLWGCLIVASSMHSRKVRMTLPSICFPRCHRLLRGRSLRGATTWILLMPYSNLDAEKKIMNTYPLNLILYSIELRISHSSCWTSKPGRYGA